MKKFIKTFIVLISVAAAIACSACSNSKFAFSYELEQTEYHRGDTVKLYAAVTYTANNVYKYTGTFDDFRASPTVYNQDSIEYVLQVQNTATHKDVGEHFINKGDTTGIYFYLTIPNDAPYGSYNLRLTCLNYNQKFESVLTVVE